MPFFAAAWFSPCYDDADFVIFADAAIIFDYFHFFRRHLFSLSHGRFRHAT